MNLFQFFKTPLLISPHGGKNGFTLSLWEGNITFCLAPSPLGEGWDGGQFDIVKSLRSLRFISSIQSQISVEVLFPVPGLQS